MNAHHLVSTLRTAARRHPESTALKVRRDGSWFSATYAETVAAVDHVAAALVELGVQVGDRCAIFSANSPEWTVVDYALQAVGAVSVPVYATSTAEQAAYILQDSGCTMAFVGDAVLYARTRAAAAQCPDLERIVLLEPGLTPERSQDLAYLDLHRRAVGQAAREEVEARLAAGGGSEVHTIVYTSGTTGDPKGVQLTHENLLAQFRTLNEHFDLGPDDRSLCLLPLSHALERGWTAFILSRGCVNVYVANPREVSTYLTQAQPTVMTAVPRVLEKIMGTAQATVGEGAKRKVFDWALQVGNEFHHLRRAGKPRPGALVAQHVVAERAVLSRIRGAMGGRFKFIACGGAALRPEVEEFFIATGLVVLEGYGMTETAPLISYNRPDDFRFGTVGKVAVGVDVRFGEEGEIQVKGANCTPGYWQDPEATAALYTEDGWLRTGDVGELDDDGFLRITDRIKDLIVTQQGKNVAPSAIENELMADELIEQAVVIGDGRKYLTALIQPSFAALEEWAQRAGTAVTDRAALVRDSAVLAEIERRIRAMGERRASYERVQKFRLVPEEMTMEDGDLTPTLKIKRKKVEAKNAELISQMYED